MVDEDADTDSEVNERDDLKGPEAYGENPLRSGAVGSALVREHPDLRQGGARPRHVPRAVSRRDPFDAL